MLWMTCRSALVCRPVLRARRVALSPDWRSGPADLKVADQGPLKHGYLVSRGCIAAARYEARVPGARRPL